MKNNALLMKDMNNQHNALVEQLRQFMESEARSCSMDPGCITPEYIYRMWGGSVSMEEIEAGLKEIRSGR